MTTLDTTVNTAIAALLADFQTIATANSPYGPTGAQSGIQVVDGLPVAYEANYVMVVAGVSNWAQRWLTLGEFGKIEDYDLDCVIRCWQGNTDPSGRRAEAFTLLNAVRLQLYTELNAGQTLNLPNSASTNIIAGTISQGPAGGTDGWGVELGFTVRVENAFLHV